MSGLKFAALEIVVRSYPFEVVTRPYHSSRPPSLLSDEALHLSTLPSDCRPECQTSTPQAQANDPISEDHELPGDGSILHNDKENEGTADISNDHDDSSSSHAGDFFSKQKVSDDVQTAQPLDGAGTDGGLSALGLGSSCGTFASTTGSSGNSGEQGENGGLLKGGLAVALSGHWRAAEVQFEDTARRVRNEYFVRSCGHSRLGRIIYVKV